MFERLKGPFFQLGIESCPNGSADGLLKKKICEWQELCVWRNNEVTRHICLKEKQV